MGFKAFTHPALLLGVIALAGCGMFKPVPQDLDYARTRLSEQGLYRLSYTTEVQPPPISRLHSWTLHLETPDGKPIDGATLQVDGDMPQHGHGLPTRPVVTRTLGHGDYLVEGMKFQMGGWWQIDVDVASGDQHDKVTFNLRL